MGYKKNAVFGVWCWGEVKKDVFMIFQEYKGLYRWVWNCLHKFKKGEKRNICANYIKISIIDYKKKNKVLGFDQA